ncbi:MAG: GHKL domain-containing protein [Lachnospiraceae bacterium]|nr:GHKL domain-containing protein [Lachnospiraceae bacterium]
MFTRRKEKLLEYQRSLVELHYNEVENMYAKMRAWRHDYHNHMQALSACLANGDIEKAQEFLEEINENLVSVDTVIKTGNTMVDAILNSKISLMNTRKIPVKADAKVPSRIAIADVDLCIIIGNLLDNAMEAAEKLPPQERFVRIYIGVKSTHLYLCFTNSAGKKQNTIGGRFLSSKGSNHGFGLNRVDSLVEKYDGYLTRASEDGGFTTEVILPLSGEPDFHA